MGADRHMKICRNKSSKLQYNLAKSDFTRSTVLFNRTLTEDFNIQDSFKREPAGDMGKPYEGDESSSRVSSPAMREQEYAYAL